MNIVFFIFVFVLCFALCTCFYILGKITQTLKFNKMMIEVIDDIDLNNPYIDEILNILEKLQRLEGEL